MFSDYLILGWDHIIDVNGYDHFLFVIVLCSLYKYTDWKKILVLVTAFTIGHCVTLILAGLQWININSTIVELLIPFTILLTSIWHLFLLKKSQSFRETYFKYEYILPLGFGLIHGLGFSNFFKALLGNESDILMPLFAFNVGIEIGQVCIILFYILFSFIMVSILKIKQSIITAIISGLAAMVSIYMLINN